MVGSVGEAEMPFRGDEPRESILNDFVSLSKIKVEDPRSSVGLDRVQKRRNPNTREDFWNTVSNSGLRILIFPLSFFPSLPDEGVVVERSSLGGTMDDDTKGGLVDQ
jgi:hypothetical protein